MTVDALDLVGAALVVALVSARVAAHVWRFKASKRERDLSCTRCGRPLEEVEVWNNANMCAECVATTHRNYSAGSLFFLGLATLFCLILLAVLPKIYGESGIAGVLRATEFFGGGILMAGAAGWGIWYAARQLR